MSQDMPLRWVQLTSGHGPAECELAVSYVLDRFLKEAIQMNLNVEVLEKVPGKNVETYQSAMLSISGEGVISFLKRWQGTVQ